MFNKIRDLLSDFSSEHIWKVLVKKTDSMSLDFSQDNIEIRNSQRYWYADPFLITANSKLYLFVEVFDRLYNRGSIGYFDLDKKIKKHKIVLRAHYHMSYPYLFILDNEYYMIPETSEIKEISIYKAVKFPDSWKKHKVIMNNVMAVDTNIMKYDNVLYMVSAFTVNNSNIVEEVIYELNDSFSVVSLISKKKQIDHGARNAGDFIFDQETIYRFTQDCRNNNYGTGIYISKFTPFKNEEIDYLSYKDVVYSNNSHCGFHTISYTGGYLALDVKYVKRNSIMRRVHLIIIRILRSFKRRLIRK